MLDVIVRFRDPRRLIELKRCVFSVVGATYRPLRVIIAAQCLSGDDLASLSASLEPIFSIAGAPALEVVNAPDRSSTDRHAALSNAGLRRASGRYLALLDQDELIYPHGYELLIQQMAAEGCGIAVASPRIVNARLHRRFVEAVSVQIPFGGGRLTDLFRGTFDPIHCYVVDRQAVPEALISFDESLPIGKDYEFLLRVCANVRSSFTLANVEIGAHHEMRISDDAFAIGERFAPSEPSARAETQARLSAMLQARRRFIRLSAEVSRALGIPDSEGAVTVADVLNMR